MSYDASATCNDSTQVDAYAPTLSVNPDCGIAHPQSLLMDDRPLLPTDDFVRMITEEHVEELNTPELRWLFREYKKLLNWQLSQLKPVRDANRNKSRRR